MEAETAGDPMTGLKWTRRTTAKIAAELKAFGIDVSPKTVARLLKQLGFSLRVNQKKVARTVNVSPQERDAQFSHIAELRELCVAERVPVISVDTKKKELIGNFKNAGQAWGRNSVAVNDHDFRSQADGIAVPFSIYDLRYNRGFVCVGTSYDTPQFAVESIARWWSRQGKRRYPCARELLILADAGGSNGPRCRLWKYELHKKLCNHYGLTVKVAHYPSGASKWNPVEHRLHSEISKNWAGRPLDSLETILNYINTTTTSTGLKVQASLIKRTYQKGIKISDAEFSKIPITYDNALPRWNYSLQPSQDVLLK
jgi:hypothetical protein